MGCKASKAAPPDLQQSKSFDTGSPSPRNTNLPEASSATVAINTKDDGHEEPAAAAAELRQDVVYQLLVQATTSPKKNDGTLPARVLEACNLVPTAAAYQSPRSQSTPLHVAVRLLGTTDGIGDVLQGLVRANPDAVRVKDKNGNIPLHYAIASASTTTNTTTDPLSEEAMSIWKTRAAVVQLLTAADIDVSMEYLSRSNVMFDGDDDDVMECSPLYRALQIIPDDFYVQSTTVEFIAVLRDACPHMVGVGNASDGDKPLALLYRRFTRQFDLAEKFFDGDNSRPEVVQHRQRYKTAAGNTWRIIECLLRPEDPDKEWKIVHRAVQVQAPPDLLRYIVETNAEDLTKMDDDGNLPIHYAAKSKPSDVDHGKTAFPAFYTKYVVDELLYKFPEAATMADSQGQLPFALAVSTGKQWIGGGIKSLYDANPAGLDQINLDEHEALRKVLMEEDATDKEEKVTDTVIPDEQHDAIMLVQQSDVDVSEVVTSMWAHEEDAGVQMLSCVAIARMVRAASSPDDILRIALLAVAAVVNAMKAHPNEVIVQEKACHALRSMACTDGKREISFVASGAVAAIVGAMQAHVSDPGAQEEACGAIAEIIHAGGAERATIVASVSGLTAIVNAIAAHPDVVGVQREACQALKELTEYPNANLPELARSQTEPLLESARAKYPVECGEAVELIMSRLS